MKKRTFTAEFKAKIVVELLRGEKDLNTLAAEHSIAPNQIRNWKNEFLENAPRIFDNKKDKEFQHELEVKEQETDNLYKRIGQLTTQVDWLKKKSEQLLGSEWESKFTSCPKR
jgi:transposase-like protein